MSNKRPSRTVKRAWLDVFFTWRDEFKAIFKDKGVIVLFVLAPLAYPILYASIYNKEVLRDAPIAVVDHSATSFSRKYLRAIDATPEVHIQAHCNSVTEARTLYENREVNGILIIPKDFEIDLANNRQATVSIYTDMISFIYYKALMSATSYVSRDLGAEIQVERLMAEGHSLQEAKVMAAPFTYSYNPVYNPTGGYASFLIPAVFILILHQTLLLGIGMLSGTAYEKNPLLYLNQIDNHRQSVFGVLAGKSLAYLVFYAVMTLYILGPVTHFFDLPHLGAPSDLILFMLPFLLATIFFAMTISVFLYNRENSMLLFLFSSIPLLFLSGVSWPSEGMPQFWKVLGWLFPSTHGIRGYVRINTMSANLSSVYNEYLSLWILTGFYFVTAYSARLIQLHRLRKESRVNNV